MFLNQIHRNKYVSSLPGTQALLKESDFLRGPVFRRESSGSSMTVFELFGRKTVCSPHVPTISSTNQWSTSERAIQMRREKLKRWLRGSKAQRSHPSWFPPPLSGDSQPCRTPALGNLTPPILIGTHSHVYTPTDGHKHILIEMRNSAGARWPTQSTGYLPALALPKSVVEEVPPQRVQDSVSETKSLGVSQVCRYTP